MNRLRMGLLGAGRWGTNYVKLLAEHPAFELTAAFDPDPQALARVEAIAPRAVAPSADAVIGAGVDALVIATPASTHAALSCRALEAGLHVLVEKPLATNVHDARRIARAAGGRVVLVGHVVFHVPVLAHLIDRLELLGTPSVTRHVRISSGARHSTEDTVWALGPHDVALALRMQRGVPSAVRARSSGPAVEAVARFSNGAESRFHFSRAGAGPIRELEVEGDGYRLRADERNGRFEECVDGCTSEIVVGTTTAPLRAQCEHFRSCIAGESEPVEAVADNVANVRVLSAMAQSLANGGGWISIEPENIGQDALRSAPSSEAGWHSLNAAALAASD
ncbi:MAG: Gfo/Idh/MocA family oxidoreductase [Polyangiaceae bacterium]|nr:Gfo/Idh/MocA family oxidoreductase [Polyangiaceae bacterium]